MSVIGHVKRCLREHPNTRDLYRKLGANWAKSRVYFCENFFGRYHTAARFDRLFMKNPDPWSYSGNPVSEERRKLILDMLPLGRYKRLLEIGCATGWMTLPLATRADELVAADISSVALARAHDRCRQSKNIRLRNLDLLTEEINDRFECIVCAGVLVFLPAAAQQMIRDRLAAVLLAGGDLILEHTVNAYPGEIAGDWIHALYRHHPELVMLQHVDVGNYAITLFRKRAR